jgi:galactose mutarotase-like enzyme
MAVGLENVVIAAGECSLTLMPSLGGKIASLRIGSHELLQAPLHPYAPRSQSMPFSASDASGWDECLPSVAECVVETPEGPAHIPDHGDLWRVSWEVLEASSDSATLRARCFSLPLEITRTLLLSETRTGWKLQLLYSLLNLGQHSVPWCWAAHPLFSVDPGDRIHLPASIDSVQVEGSVAATLGPSGNTLPWPVVTRTTGQTSDLSSAQSPSSGIGDKVFAGPFPQHSGAWAALERPQAGLRLTVHFEPAITPYLGLWLCYGGWPESQQARQFCVALEPTTAPVDSLARSGPWSRSLAPGATCTWPMTLDIDRIPLRNEANPV